MGPFNKGSPSNMLINTMNYVTADSNAFFKKVNTFKALYYMPSTVLGVSSVLNNLLIKTLQEKNND